MRLKHRADPGFLAVSPQVTLVINPVTFHQAYSYFPSQRDHPFARYQIILIGQSHTGVIAYPRPLCNGAQPGLEPTTCKSQVRRSINSTTVRQMPCLHVK